jgi:hypothetical protein
MEKRKAYILASLPILIALTSLAFWYLYTTKETATLGEVSELELYTNVYQDPSGSSQSSSPTKQEGISVNEIIQPATEEPEVESWQLSQIHPEPTVGAAFNKELIQFVDQKTGNIFQKSVSGATTKTSSIIIKDIRDAYLMEDSSVLVMRNNQELPARVELSETATSTIEYGLYDAALNITQAPEQGGGLYYTTPNDGRGVTIRPIKNPAEEIWSSSLRDWVLQATNNSIIVTQKASYNIPGYAYLLSQTNNDNNPHGLPITQDLPGLIVNVSPDDKKILYSTSGTAGLELFLQDTTLDKITQLSVSTLASKCVWSTDSITLYCALPSDIPSKLPDNWYKGQVHFTDDLWRIDSDTGAAFELAHNTNLDIIDLKERVGGDALIFKNKTDQSLWAVIKE